MKRVILAVSIIALVLVAAASASAREKTIVIFINGHPLDVTEYNPAVLTDDMFVPARALAEAAGATVTWDPATKTMTMKSNRGEASFTIGSHWGRIRGQKVYWPYYPYVWGGQSYAPMLFFYNQNFDQAWYFDPFYGQFRWCPIFPRFRGGLRPPMVIQGPGIHRPRCAPQCEPECTPEDPPECFKSPECNPLTGCAVRPVPSERKKQIVLEIGSKSVTYPISDRALVLRGSVGGQMSEVMVEGIRPGDHVVFQTNSAGEIVALRAEYSVVRGTVSSVSAAGVLLDTGLILPVLPMAQILMPDNRSGEVRDIKVGDAIAARLNPKDWRAYLIQVQKAENAVDGTDERGQVCLNNYGPLTTGDVLEVWFKANAGGKAWFTIPGVKANIRMQEAFPGFYMGKYQIQQGDIALNVPVKVIFTLNDGRTFIRLTSRPLNIGTVCDYLPRITTPRQGEQIISPVVVRGEAQPGSQIRVVIEFRRDMRLIFPLQGTTAIQDVTADCNGHWVTPPLSAWMPFSDADPDLRGDFGVLQDWFHFNEEPPTVYTITAISIGPCGEERTAFQVEVTKRDVSNVGGLTPAPVE